MHLWLPVLLGAIFVANILAGKYATATGADIPHFRDVPEFLLLLATAAAFTWSALAAERRDAPDGSGGIEPRSKSNNGGSACSGDSGPAT